MTITSSITTVKTDTRIANFLSNYAGFEYAKALDYVREYPDEAEAMAKKIRQSILDDKGMSQGYKDKIKI